MSLKIEAVNREELGDNQALFSGSNFMQTLFWADLKGDYGFKPNFFIISRGEFKEGLIVMIRPIAKGFSIAYIPHGPSKRFSLEDDLSIISGELKKYLPGKCILIRYDLLTEKCEHQKLKKSVVSVQVPDTTILNLEPEEETLLKGMHKKTRYNIKLAGKKGVTIREAGIDELDSWYSMYETTARRDSIAIHSKEYYRSVYNRAREYSNTDMKLFFAEHEGDLLAGIFVLLHGDGATYLYGASSNIKRNLMPAYLLQWYAIQFVKNNGAKNYDFFGIPPVNDKNHSMYGLYRFKTGFGGDLVHRAGCYDYLLHPLAGVFRFLEILRNFYYKKLRKR